MYRNLILLLIFFGILSTAIAQQPGNIDLKFDQRFTRCEKKWVVLPKKPAETKYMYGYIYIDQQAGFTFDLKGSVTIDDNGKFIADTSATKNGMIKVRISPNWPAVALLPPSRFAEINIQPEPYWIKNYYTYTDTLHFKFRRGFTYNASADCETAITYLTDVYKVKPQYTGLAFEMAYAYNVLNQGDKAIAVLGPAIKATPKDVMLYRELGFAYALNKDVIKAVDSYKKGLEQCADNQNETKSEFAYNIGMTYKNSGNTDEYKNWMVKAKGWSAPNSNIYKAVTGMGL